MEPNNPLCFALFFSAIIFWPAGRVTSFGINYGRIGNNLPSPETAVRLVKCTGATKVKLYDADPNVLRAFANTGVELIISVGNERLREMKDCDKAQDWVDQSVRPYLPATKITTVIVGNEVLSSSAAAPRHQDLLPAMQNVYYALQMRNLSSQIRVTTAHSLAVLEASYPPSSGVFRKNLTQDFLCEILGFLNSTGSPFYINAYPYFAVKADPEHVNIDYALSNPDSGITDDHTHSHYDNLLFAQIDAVYAASAQLGYNSVCVEVSETGWPSKGDPDETSATQQNARAYNGNLLSLLAQKKRTPLTPPNCGMEAFLFALFNENMKPGPTSERNYGLFNADGSPSYDLGFAACGMNAGNNSGSCGPVGGVMPQPPASNQTAWSPWNSYMSITSDAVQVRLPRLCSKWMCSIIALGFLCTLHYGRKNPAL
ncbi:unnamed protein product [Cuscuta campestris]|uniref:glucan endo-1,3-beta-D-glucosidase n=1 Tax=Cuscuta campestris TaxID=132261 RepID=A0A484KD92_9ASTE|nr:unnamed protein product [Cuscuta campestris]